MKKKNLSFMTLFMLTATLVGGCSCGKQSNENVSNLVIKVGDKEYSAKELYNDLLSTGIGANEAFSKILRLVVEQSMETTSNIQAAADLAAESFEKEVENDAAANGISKEESRKKLLEQKGYTSVEQMKSDIIYEQKLTRITESYWEENKESYFEGYIQSRLPYLVRHILVKIDDTNANKIANNVSISQTDGQKLVDVIKDLEKEGDFDTVARFESEDTGSNITGGAYYMDNTYGANGFVDEFVYGTYAFDTYTTKSVEGDVTTYTYGANQTKLNKLSGLNDTDTFAKYYKDGFNFVDMSIVNMMGEVYNKTTLSNKDYFTIDVVDSEGKTASNLNSTENYYARSILFNNAFNKPGVSVIGYSSKTEAEESAAHYVEFKNGNDTKYILADENDNPIFFVAARGSSNQIWVHFLTINVSALDDIENAKKFFSLNPSSEDNYVSYVELMSKKEGTQEMNTYINELEGYVKSYATAGIGSSVGEESLLKYDMVAHYMSENDIKYVNKDLEAAVLTYIENRRKYLKLKLDNSISEDWDTHTDKLALSMDPLIQSGIKPYECGVYVDSEVTTRNNPYTALTTSDHLCRYVYGKGYELQLSFYYETTSSGSSNESFTKVTKNHDNRLWFTETVYNEYQYVTIGEDNAALVLPTPEVKDGFVFKGWYTDKDLTQAVTTVDLSESRMTNKTIFFAKVEAAQATTINYTYKYEDGTLVDADIVSGITNTNDKSKVYSASGNNTVTLDGAKISSAAVTFEKFQVGGQDATSLDIAYADMNQTKEVVVIVSPKATTIVYEYVTLTDANTDGFVDAEDADTNPYLTSYTYNPGASDYNVAILTSAFEWSTAQLEAKSIRVVRYGETFKDVEVSELTLSEEDMGKVITVYVIVEAKQVQGGE